MLTGAGLIKTGTGLYSLTATTPANLTAELRALTFTPTNHQVAPGSTVTTTFGVTVAEGSTSKTASTNVVATAARDLPTITGATAGQAVADNATIKPFAGVVVGDGDAGQAETVTVQLSSAANGTLSDANAGTDGSSYNAASGLYTVVGSAAAVTAALEGLTFTPTAHEVAPGQTVTTAFSITDTNTAGASTTNTTSSVIATAQNTPYGTGYYDLSGIAGSSVSVSVLEEATVTFNLIGLPDTFTISSAIGSAVTINNAIDSPTLLNVETNGGLVTIGALVSGLGAVNATISGGGVFDVGQAATEALNEATIIFGEGGGTLVIGTAGAPANIETGMQIAGLTSSADVIDDQSLSFTGSTSYTVSGNGSVQTITIEQDGHYLQFTTQGANLTPGTFDSPVNGPLKLSDDGHNGTEITLCYLRGTRIVTPTGVSLIEDLKIGDPVVTRFQGIQPIKWIGWQRFSGQFLKRNPDKHPVCIKAGAIGPSLPANDLYVTPAHSMLVDGVLVLAENLVNGLTITKDVVPEEVHYFQIEMEKHDCIIAEGTWSETYADCAGLRGQFHNASDFYQLYPDEPANSEPALCAPRPMRGPQLDAALRPLVARAQKANVPGILRGFIDLIDCNGELHGWAQDLSYPDLPVLLEVLLNNKPIGTVLACEKRMDLVVAGVGRGHASFSFSSPKLIYLDSMPAVKVRRLSDGAELQATLDCRNGTECSAIARPCVDRSAAKVG